MHKTILIAFMVLGFFIFTEDIFGQQIYQTVDKKGTINFSDNPNSPVLDQEKGPQKENGIEVLKRLDMGNRPLGIGSGGKSIRLGHSTRSGSGGGGSTTVRTRRS
jgi:hypothetical protein